MREECIVNGLPRYVRINTLRTTLSEQKKKLTSSGHTFQKKHRNKRGKAERRKPDKKIDPRGYSLDEHVPNLLVFRPKGHSDISRIPSVLSGELIIQQKASCFSALALNPPVGGSVIDACAAPGSKTSHLATMMENEGSIYAFDRNPARVETMKTLLAARGITNVIPKALNFCAVEPKDFFDVTHILLDPSCSSSGVSSEPHDDPKDIADLAENQLNVINHAMSFPSVEVVVYSTCSVYNQENEHVVHTALETNPEFRLEKTLPTWPRRGRALSECPGLDHEALVRSVIEDGTIGFFLARFVRIGSTAAEEAKAEGGKGEHDTKKTQKRKLDAPPTTVGLGYKPGAWRKKSKQQNQDE